MEATNAQDQVFTGEGLAAQIDETPGAIIGVTAGPAVEAEPIDEATLLTQLEEKLKFFKFPVKGLSPSGIRYINNFIRDKAKFSDTRDAYWLTVLAMDIAKIVNDDLVLKLNPKQMETIKDYEMRAFTIQAANYFLSKNEGTGLASAQKMLSVAQPINNALVQVQVVEAQHEALKKKLASAKPEVQADQVTA